ncbi:Transcription initiation factor TFIID subunit 13 [Mitosporidium daphniae]|uniref:Transcription initiation factor TFIID subunit 13 n=1 Tax=Mitosporidium daphniae TaxID=1485682 RepID=A0A098VTP9_9MICR|nr:transcription initiation factor TFIID [Mitosporidium daphniae]KGG51101.1 transcription initiation factor TFIID [Mitosporidium daphniae]|eukprot:XP_013237550.1 transcription initiation factor TFIID [Mitosporidium daphniae]
MSMASQSIGGKSSTRRVEKRVLIKELRTMLYGFGDVPVPRQDTVEVVEDCLFDFLTRFVAKPRGGKVRTEDLLTVLKRDPRKLGRVEELLFMNVELRKARMAFETEE